MAMARTFLGTPMLGSTFVYPSKVSLIFPSKRSTKSSEILPRDGPVSFTYPGLPVFVSNSSIESRRFFVNLSLSVSARSVPLSAPFFRNTDLLGRTSATFGSASVRHFGSILRTDSLMRPTFTRATAFAIPIEFEARIFSMRS